MAKVRVKVPAALRQYWGGQADVTMTAASLDEALHGLGPLTSRVLDDAGAIRRHVNVFVNSRPAKDLALPLSEGDVIHILPAVSGGSA